MGEVSERPGAGGDGAHTRVEGLAVDLAARISSLAHAGQVLMSAPVADSARQRIDARHFHQPVLWKAHGSYLLKGFEEPLEIREAGLEGVARFVAPSGSQKARPAHPLPISTRRRRKVLVATGGALGLAVVIVYAASNGPSPEIVSSGDRARTTATRLNDVRRFEGRPAIAVLPFDNLSPDPDQAFFADGLAEDLITRLASWRAFPVIARNSSFRYRGGNLDLERVGAELGARYLVEGSVRRSGNRIRVTAQLIDATYAEHVWAETYDRAVADVFALQDEIGATIAASLVGDLTRAEGERAQQQGTDDLEAWSAYQLGLQHADRYTAEDAVEAARLLEHAVELDPRFATAHARLALVQWMALSGDGSAATPEQVSAALEIARRAVALDPREPIAYGALAAVHLMAGDPQNALDAARKAVDLNPSMPEAWIWLGWAQLLAGDPEACITATERAQALDPQGPMVWIYDSLALAYWETGRYEAALDAGRRLIAIQPDYFTGYLYVAMSSVSLGEIDTARAAIAEGRRVRPDLSIDLMQNYLAVARPEVDVRRNAALRTAGLE
jgi:adenylate cyclase